MGELPASVRVAVWGTAALNGQLPVDRAVRQALPDIDEVSGLEEQLSLWRDLGERAVLVALPRPGDLAGMPTGSRPLLDAALVAEELVFVPGLGGALVPAIEAFGPPGDQGWTATWTAYDADPVPVHRLQAMSLPDIELQLRQELSALTGELAGTATGSPHAPSLEQVVRDRGASRWGVPPGLPPRALRVIELSGTVGELVQAGLDVRMQSVDSSTTLHRERLLRRLQDHASTALAAATNLAVLDLAGWR